MARLSEVMRAAESDGQQQIAGHATAEQRDLRLAEDEIGDHQECHQSREVHDKVRQRRRQPPLAFGRHRQIEAAVAPASQQHSHHKAGEVAGEYGGTDLTADRVPHRPADRLGDLAPEPVRQDRELAQRSAQAEKRFGEQIEALRHFNVEVVQNLADQVGLRRGFGRGIQGLQSTDELGARLLVLQRVDQRLEVRFAGGRGCRSSPRDNRPGRLRSGRRREQEAEQDGREQSSCGHQRQDPSAARRRRFSACSQCHAVPTM